MDGAASSAAAPIPPRPASGTSCSRAGRATGCGTTRRCARRFASTLPADHRRRRRHQRQRAHGARAGAHARALPFPPATRGRVPGRGPGQGQAGRRVRRSVHEQRARARRAPGGRDEGEVQLLLEFKVDDIVDWLWEEMQLPNLKARVGPSEECDWIREGWDRRGARSRLDRRRSFKELVKRRGALRRAPRPSPTRICASGSWRGAASRRCTRWCSSCSMSRAACPTATASSPRRSSSGWCRGCGASTARSRPCSWRTPPRPGNSTSRISSR